MDIFRSLNWFSNQASLAVFSDSVQVLFVIIFKPSQTKVTAIQLMLVALAMIQLQPWEVVAAAIPQSTQPFGVLLQQIEPTPQQPSLQSEQQSPPLMSIPPPQDIFPRVPVIIFLAQERSKPPLKPRALQSGTAGLQMQQPAGVYPVLHLGYTIAPLCSQFPWPLSFSHLLNIPLLLKPSSPRHPYPTPLPYSTSRQKSPWSAQPGSVGQFWWQSIPLLEYPTEHGLQQSAPIWSNEPHILGTVPAPLLQLSLQQNLGLVLMERHNEYSTSKSTVINAKILFIFKQSKIRHQLLSDY